MTCLLNNANSPLHARELRLEGPSTAGILLPALSEPSEASCSCAIVSVGPGTVAKRNESSAPVIVSNDIAWPPQS